LGGRGLRLTARPLLPPLQVLTTRVRVHRHREEAPALSEGGGGVEGEEFATPPLLFGMPPEAVFGMPDAEDAEAAGEAAAAAAAATSAAAGGAFLRTPEVRRRRLWGAGEKGAAGG
jgi:hypothetical protein